MPGLLYTAMNTNFSGTTGPADDMKYLIVFFIATRIGCLLTVRADSICRAEEYFYMNHSKDYGSCYKFDMVRRTWSVARRYCREQGGDLVSIETEEENEFLRKIMLKTRHHPTIRTYIERKNLGGFWTSGSDKDKEGAWMWTATCVEMTYQNWYPRQPSNWGGNEHHMNIIAVTGKWNDSPDSDLQFSVCERIRLF